MLLFEQIWPLSSKYKRINTCRSPDFVGGHLLRLAVSLEKNSLKQSALNLSNYIEIQHLRILQINRWVQYLIWYNLIFACHAAVPAKNANFLRSLNRDDAALLTFYFVIWFLRNLSFDLNFLIFKDVRDLAFSHEKLFCKLGRARFWHFYRTFQPWQAIT